MSNFEVKPDTEVASETPETDAIVELTEEVIAAPETEKAPEDETPAPTPHPDNQTLEIVTKALPETADDVTHTLKIYRFGAADARPKIYLQAGLHADELPGQLVLRLLIDQLNEAVERGTLIGQVVVVPVANPIGLAQIEGGYMQGRVEKATGRNFNRGFPDLAALARKRVVGRFDTEDDAANVAKIRAGMLKGLAAIETHDAFDALQITLLSEACDSDIVLDLHADNEAQLHLYTQTAAWPNAQDLAAELDARAVLLTDVSGGEPFDETCSRPWFALKAKQEDAAIPAACFSATVELRSNNDVSMDYARNDARALVRFMMRRGVLAGEPGALPRLLCEATDLRAMQQLKAPCEGVINYRARLGDRVRTGDVIAQIIPAEGDIAEVKAVTDGILFARHNQTWAWDGKVIGKIAGSEVLEDRQGALLTD
ncbi:MAG: succinylglutamate desuccinylase/aspartoacylase family protein [Pseudomonadota bacterium]